MAAPAAGGRAAPVPGNTYVGHMEVSDVNLSKLVSTIKKDKKYQGSTLIFHLLTLSEQEWAENSDNFPSQCTVQGLLDSAIDLFGSISFMFRTDVDFSAVACVECTTPADISSARGNLHSVIKAFTTGEAKEVVCSFERSEAEDAVQQLNANELTLVPNLRKAIDDHLEKLKTTPYGTQSPRYIISKIQVLKNIYNKYDDVKADHMSTVKQKNILCQILVNCKDPTIYSSLKTLRQHQRPVFDAYSWSDLVAYVYSLYGEWVADHGSNKKGNGISFATEKASGSESDS